MDNETRSWLVGVPFVTGPLETRERLALSRGQKRELAGVTGLVMASTVFFLTPLLLSSPSEVPATVHGVMITDEPPRTEPRRSTAAALAAVQPAPSMRAALQPAPSMRRAAAPMVNRRVGADRFELRMPTAPIARERVAAMNRQVTHAVRTRPEARGRAAKRKGISEGILRALVGSGRYRVQPFPTPASGD